MTLLAGGPAVAGLWIGSLAYAPQWSALALAVGAGAILQVIAEVGSLLVRRSGETHVSFFTPAAMTGTRHRRGPDVRDRDARKI